MKLIDVAEIIKDDQLDMESLFKLNASMFQAGESLQGIVVTSPTWAKIIESPAVLQMANTANIENEDSGGLKAVLRALPWLTWQIKDDGTVSNTQVGIF